MPQRSLDPVQGHVHVGDEQWVVELGQRARQIARDVVLVREASPRQDRHQPWCKGTLEVRSFVIWKNPPFSGET